MPTGHPPRIARYRPEDFATGGSPDAGRSSGPIRGAPSTTARPGTTVNRGWHRRGRRGASGNEAFGEKDHTSRRPTMTNSLRQLADEGVAVWLDDMGRERLVSGSLKALVRDRCVVGVTTNPTIFQKAITGSDVYAEQMRDLACLRVPVEEAIDFMVAHDVRAVCDLLRPVYDRTEGIDGRVSARGHRLPGRGDQRQRHPDLLAGPVHRRGGRLSDRPGTGPCPGP